VNSEKDNIRMTRDVMLENCLDLAQLHNPRIGSQFLEKKGLKTGSPTDSSTITINGSSSASGRSRLRRRMTLKLSTPV
jgi:hypothetical protein